jgi:hypothetical protein
MDRAEQVRQILSAKGTTLYRISQESAQVFGRPSRFYIPHNLYSDVTGPFFVPTIYQMFALSQITNYRLSDWLAVFGFDLDLISRLRLLIPRQQTTLLDAMVYDASAWVPWLDERELDRPAPPIAPLGQFLAVAAPRRATDLLAMNQRRFIYARVGKADIHALPHLAADSIVRIRMPYSRELLSGTRSSPEPRLFCVEHNSGWTCSQLAMLGKDRVLLRSPQRPCAQRELVLGKEARILGVIDAEIRPVQNRKSLQLPAHSIPVPRSHVANGADSQSGFKYLLLASRIRVGLSFREASSISRWIATTLSDELYFAAASTLSDYETLSSPPRQIQKVITLCLLYCIDFDQFLRVSGLPIEQAGHEPMPDELVRRRGATQNPDSWGLRGEDGLPKRGEFLRSLIQQWEEIPLFLWHSLPEITHLKNFSLQDAFWVGGVKDPLHPWLVSAVLVSVNRRMKKPPESRAKSVCEQPLYVVLKRDATYLCGRCTLDGGNLLVHSYPGGPVGAQRFRNGADAEIVGQITAILRRLV